MSPAGLQRGRGPRSGSAVLCPGLPFVCLTHTTLAGLSVRSSSDEEKVASEEEGPKSWVSAWLALRWNRHETGQTRMGQDRLGWGVECGRRGEVGSTPIFPHHSVEQSPSGELLPNPGLGSPSPHHRWPLRAADS